MMKQSSFQAVLFDLDGLIVDTEPYQFRAFQTLLERRGIHLPESMMDTLLGYDEITNLRQLKPIYNLTEEPEELLKERRQIYLETIQQEPIHALEGFWEVSEEARRQGMRQAIVSSSPRQYVEIVLARLFEERPQAGEYSSYFEEIICGEDAGRAKPAPDIYLLAASRLKVAPKECLVFEDSPAGVQAAAAAGMSCLAVVTRYARPEDFSGARAVFTSLRESLPFLRGKTAG
jgi:HAD superfamily hydrolase (TIGR01509 family)